ncbi:MAG: PEP/pyruvate-binding domain-containing protein, partial [Bdellovibrionota bacterium]
MKLAFLLMLFSAPSALAAGTPVSLQNLCAEKTGHDYTFLIDSANQYEFSGGREETKWIKFAVLNCPDGTERLVFQNSQTFVLHFDFLTAIDAFKGLTRAQVDQISLHDSGRKALFGVLSYDGYGSSDFRYQLISADRLSPESVSKVQRLLSVQMKMQPLTLSYAPGPTQRKFVQANLDDYRNALGVPIIFPGSGDDTIVYASGWSAGQVKITTAADIERRMATGEIDRSSIVVLDESPADMAPLAGVITSLESSPFGHVALLNQMLGSVFFYEKDAAVSQKWKSRENTNVFIQADSVGANAPLDSSGGSLEIRDGLSDADVAFLNSLRRPKAQTLPPANLTRRDFVTLTALADVDLDAAGAKAVNLALVCGALRDCPKGFAIPFHYQNRFFDETVGPSGQRLRDFVRTKLTSVATANTTQVKKALSAIRKEIRGAAIAPRIFDPIALNLKATFGSSPLKLRLRSSSNVEDLKNFNGAGIYESEGAFLNDEKDVKEAIKKVWSSIYTEKAYFARQQAGLAGAEASMAILVHPAYRGEL